MTVEQYNFCVDKYSDNLFRFILKIAKDEEKAKDIIQESYEKLWIKLETVDGEKAKSYLFSTAYHIFINNYRKDKRISAFDSEISINLIDNSQYSDLNEILHSAINRLPEIQKSVILLRDYEGYSYEEIGKITDLSESQVKVYIFRARTFLKNFIVSLETVI
jgi:RNA polymerase sigma factor (sigma-70 family)